MLLRTPSLRGKIAIVLVGTLASLVLPLAMPSALASSLNERIVNGATPTVCLNVNNSNYPSNGNKVQLGSCDHSNNQIWIESGAHIINAYSGLCLAADSNVYPANGAQILLWSCDSNPQQSWTIQSNGTIKNGSHNICIDANSTDYPNSGDKVQEWSCNPNDEQVWQTDKQCPAASSSHTWANQYTVASTYDGMSGELPTNTPLLSNYNNDTSISHLQLNPAICNGCTFPEVEIGWGIGQDYSGDNPINPEFYIAWDDEYGIYNEVDTGGFPTLHVTYPYLIAYGGYDFLNGATIWLFYYGPNLVHEYTGYVVGMNAGNATAGGEVINGYPGLDHVQMDATGTTPFTVTQDNGAGVNWDTSIPSGFCDDPGMVFTPTTKYQAYSATGNL